MVGRKSKVSLDRQIELYVEHSDQLINNGEIVPCTSKIYYTLSEMLDMTPKAVYLTVKRHSQKVFPTADLNGLNTDNIEDTVEGNSPAESDCESENSVIFTSDSENDSKKENHFEIDITNDKIFEIKENGSSVKHGWSDKLFMALWEHTEIDCVWSFKRAWIRSGSIILAKGNCKECKGEVKVKTYDNKKLFVKIENCDRNFGHTGRRKMKGELKKKVLKSLENKNAFKVRLDLINKTNNSKKNLPRNIPSLNALRVAKYKDSLKQLPESDPIESILNWKTLGLRDVIWEVGISPFCVIYCTQLQKEWYKTESKNQRMVLAIDATGSVVQPPKNSEISKTTQQLKHVFFYNVMAKRTNAKSVPILQMLSQKHTSEWIAYWLGAWSKDISKKPAEIVIDGSKALLLAIIKIFTTRTNVKNYIHSCMMSIKTGILPPECYIRYDRSHFIKNLHRNIKEKDYRKKRFYLSVCGYLIQCDRFDVAEKIIQDFFTVLLNKFDGIGDDGEKVPAENAKKRLLRLCSTHVPEEYDEHEEDEAESTDLENILDEDINVDWIRQIIEKIPVSEQETEHDNLYYDPKKETFFIKLFSTIVLWSNIANHVFQSDLTTATSSDVESNIKTVKTTVTEKKQLRADKFIKLHLEYLAAELRLSLCSNAKNSSSSTKQGTLIS